MTSTRTIGQLAAAVVVISAAAASLTFASAPAAQAVGSGRVVASPCLNLRSGPGAIFPVVACVPTNVTIAIDCTASGPSVTGPYGATTLWNHTSYAGKSGFVSDAWVYTGSWNPVAPGCSSQPQAPAPAPAPASSRADRAVAWANSMIGSQAYPSLCERFVENAFGTSQRYISALAAFNSLRSAGKMRYTSTGIPKGALVFSRNPRDGGYGHVQLSRGDGTFVMGGSLGRATVAVSTSPGAGGTFIGWAYAPDAWPGR